LAPNIFFLVLENVYWQHENKQKETIVNGKTNLKKVAQTGKPLIFETLKGGQRRGNRQPAGHFAPTYAEPWLRPWTDALKWDIPRMSSYSFAVVFSFLCTSEETVPSVGHGPKRRQNEIFFCGFPIYSSRVL